MEGGEAAVIHGARVRLRRGIRTYKYKCKDEYKGISIRYKYKVYV